MPGVVELEKTNQILCILYKVMYFIVIVGCKLCHLQMQLSESPSVHQFNESSPLSPPYSPAGHCSSNNFSLNDFPLSNYHQAIPPETSAHVFLPWAY